MLRQLLFVVLLLTGTGLQAQPFNNEWIDHSKTYYKFPIRNSQLCRIPKSTLVSAGLGDIPAEQFQLWRNGKEVAIYTTQATGPLAADGFIEFCGRQNDGEPDNVLYVNVDDRPNNRPVFTDTAWYFLTQNIGPNARLVQTANNVAGTLLPADSFFTYSQEQLFPQGYSAGFALNPGFDPTAPYSGTEVRSSVFDRGEGWFYSEFRKSQPTNFVTSNLRVYPKSPPIKLEFKAEGHKSWIRNILVYMNDSLLGATPVTYFEMVKKKYENIPLSRISANGTTVIRFTTDLDDAFPYDPDKVYLQSLILTYQRTFNFNNSFLFDLTLPANVNGNHLRIGAAGHGNVSSVLYDLTNGKRYLGVVKADSSLFVLEPSATPRQLAVVNQNLSRITTITGFTPVNFIDFSQPANQADYMIISSKLLYDYKGHNFVEDYRAYRSSILGGSYNTKVYEMDQLADQFAFGSRKSPLAVKNFILFADSNFSIKPKYVLLLGRGSNYLDYRVSNNPLKDYMNSVPTYGHPASDNLLASKDNIDVRPVIPIGRISAVNGKEIGDYLNKVKQFEAINNSNDHTPEKKEWKKETIQLIGGDDEFLSGVIGNFMSIYAKIISDTSIGARVKSYKRIDNPHFADDMLEITNRINDGAGLITYFGHSSASSIDFNMSNPADYNNSNGKYPVIIANGCKAGNLFDFNVARAIYYGQSISDRFIFSPNRGAIAFISNSDYGIINYLNLFTTEWYKSAARSNYGKGIGNIQQTALRNTIGITTLLDFNNRMNCEQVVLHADPALVIFPDDKPDYYVGDSLVKISPFNATVAEDSLLVNVKFLNIGKSIVDSVWAEIRRELPDGREQLIKKVLFRKLYGEDSIVAKIAVKGLFDKGTNYIIASIDPANEWDEISENNNTVRVPFEVSDEEIRPVYPYSFAIVNQPGFLLTGSTVNPIEGERTYRLQVDTTEEFNSPLLYQSDTTSIGGAVSYLPQISWSNGTVYYWRLAPVFNGQPVNWKNSSFQYLQGVSPGFGQSHFYQHQKSKFVEVDLDANSRLFKFGKNLQSLYIVNSVYGFSGDEDNHFSISTNGVMSIYSACKGHSIVFNVFDTLTFKPWDNDATGKFKSEPVCNYGRFYNFEYEYYSSANRKKAMDFIDSIPKGMFVTARLILDPNAYGPNFFPYYDSSFVRYWQRDTLIYGPGKSLYHSLLNQGFYEIDKMNTPRTFLFAFKKDDSTAFKPVSRVSDSIYDRLNKSIFMQSVDSIGAIISPKFGPAKSWKEMHWMGHQPFGISPESQASVELIGVDNAGKETVLKTYLPGLWNNDISDVSAAQYPYLRLRLDTRNSVKAIPYQLDYWRLFYDPVPDGALSARDHYLFNKPILLTAKDTLKIELAFKNISQTFLDSTRATVKIGDRNGIIATYQLGKLKPLQPQDTALISFTQNTSSMDGKYYALIEVNKELNPVEQYSFNNFAYLPFEVVTSLPVTLVDFAAKASANNTVLLNWNVSNETDVKTYTLEYGTSSSNLNFLNQWNASNGGAANMNYNWLHVKPAIGINYYRLKITYLNGRVEYSPVRQVIFGKTGIISIYPNPFKNNLWVTGTPDGKPWTVEIFNAQGQKMLTRTGIGSQNIGTQHFAAGVYLAKLYSDGEVRTIKLEKSRD